jgi:protease-4
MSFRFFLFTLLLVSIVLMAGSCTGLNIRLGTPSEKPLKEFTLEGKERGKVLIIPVTGFLSDTPKKGLFEQRPSEVQEVVSRLRRAEKDEEVKALVFEINSPGGSITASDILYHEIMDFKERTGARVVAALMDVAASGGYYIALPADRIVAHPTTITGSVGVILVQPKVTGLMDKLGLAVEVNKSGSEKDIGSPFRPSTREEQKIMQGLTDDLGGRFVRLVTRHRQVRPEDLAKVASARIYLASEALQLKLIDAVGYLRDAISAAKALAGLPEGARVVVYRRIKYPNDNVYNTSLSASAGVVPPLIEMNLPEILPPLTPGFYYLWLPGAGGN